MCRLSNEYYNNNNYALYYTIHKKKQILLINWPGKLNKNNLRWKYAWMAKVVDVKADKQ